MRRATKRIAAGLVATALTTSLIATPAAADEPFKSPDYGLVFYSSSPTLVVGRQAAPDTLCHPLPSRANWFLAWSGGFRQLITLYEAPDCTGLSLEYPVYRQFPSGGAWPVWAAYKTS